MKKTEQILKLLEEALPKINEIHDWLVKPSDKHDTVETGKSAEVLESEWVPDDTFTLQLQSLDDFMRALGYVRAYNNSYWNVDAVRHKYTYISFRRAVELHNAWWEQCLDNPVKCKPLRYTLDKESGAMVFHEDPTLEQFEFPIHIVNRALGNRLIQRVKLVKSKTGVLYATSHAVRMLMPEYTESVLKPFLESQRRLVNDQNKTEDFCS